MSDVHRRTEAVQSALAAAGVTTPIRKLDEHARTAAVAAEQLGCDVAAIANSLVFMADGEPLLVMASGAARVDPEVIAAAVGATVVERATADQVRSATGQVIGGVAPTGHPAPLRTVIDRDLADHETLWAAGGTPDSIVPLTHRELVAVTDGQVARVR